MEGLQKEIQWIKGLGKTADYCKIFYKSYHIVKEHTLLFSFDINLLKFCNDKFQKDC